LLGTQTISSFSCSTWWQPFPAGVFQLVGRGLNSREVASRLGRRFTQAYRPPPTNLVSSTQLVKLADELQLRRSCGGNNRIGMRRKGCGPILLKNEKDFILTGKRNAELFAGRDNESNRRVNYESALAAFELTAAA
jgi:hypothetical protein